MSTELLTKEDAAFMLEATVNAMEEQVALIQRERRADRFLYFCLGVGQTRGSFLFSLAERVCDPKISSVDVVTHFQSTSGPAFDKLVSEYRATINDIITPTEDLIPGYVKPSVETSA